jgi:hypothetical protein
VPVVVFPDVYYDDPIQRIVRYRVEPHPRGWTPQTDGWRSVHSGIFGLRLRVSDEAIEVRGFGPFGRLMEAFRPLKLKLSLAPRETTMWTTRLPDLGSWQYPTRPKADCVALSCKLPNDSEYTLAVRPSDGDLDRLRDALKMAGVSES